MVFHMLLLNIVLVYSIVPITTHKTFTKSNLTIMFAENRNRLLIRLFTAAIGTSLLLTYPVLSPGATLFTV